MAKSRELTGAGGLFVVGGLFGLGLWMVVESLPLWSNRWLHAFFGGGLMAVTLPHIIRRVRQGLGR